MASRPCAAGGAASGCEGCSFDQTLFCARLVLWLSMLPDRGSIALHVAFARSGRCKAALRTLSLSSSRRACHSKRRFSFKVFHSRQPFLFCAPQSDLGHFHERTKILHTFPSPVPQEAAKVRAALMTMDACLLPILLGCWMNVAYSSAVANVWIRADGISFQMPARIMPV